jgi:RNA polymerase sigma-70 factor, ECF subfamily
MIILRRTMPATIDQFEIHRSALMAHCYRILGSSADADDAVQETAIRAWKARENFDARSSLRTWLYRIATNVCLDALAARSRRFRSVDLGPPGDPANPSMTREPHGYWLEPIPDKALLRPDSDLLQRESVRMAFVAALQSLTPKQRAALLMVDVLEMSAAEAAQSLEMSVASLNSALQRARAAVEGVKSAGSPALSDDQTALLNQYVHAFEQYDVDRLVTLLHHEVAFSMPPFSLWLQGPQSVRHWLLGKGLGCKGSRLVAVGTASGGCPAFGQYRVDFENGGHSPWALLVLEVEGSRITAWTSYLDTRTMFPLFGLPLRLPESSG